MRCFAAVFPELSPDEICHVSSEATGHWDSLSLVTLTSLVQEEFDIEIQPDAVPDLNSFKAFRAYIESASCRSKEL
jgi:acyl carrier protein